MVSPERERSSSSQSVRVQQLSRSKRRRPGQEIHVVLSDASSFFVSMRVWEEAPFHEGDELPADHWESILHRSVVVQARGQALSLLARSEHTRFLLTHKLLQRDIPAEVVELVLDDLESSGALDDARYAQAWVRSRLRAHPEDRRHMVARLRERGVGADTAEHAVDTVLRDESADAAALARDYAERLTRRRAVSSEELSTKLTRRGFDFRIVKTIVAEFAAR